LSSVGTNTVRQAKELLDLVKVTLNYHDAVETLAIPLLDRAAGIQDLVLPG
jgi:hypothetical protein